MPGPLRVVVTRACPPCTGLVLCPVSVASHHIVENMIGTPSRAFVLVIRSQRRAGVRI